MTTDLSALADPLAPTYSDTPEGLGPECRCGCGERLPEGSAREYKRGHKARPRGAAQSRTAPRNPSQSDPDMLDTGGIGGYSFDDAARDTPNDADPADMDPARPPVIRITKRIRDDIEGKLGMMYGFMAMGIEMRDPICGAALTSNADTICAKMVPIICKSPELVKWFTKSGGYMVWFELVMVFMPVIQVMVQHHITHSIGTPGKPNLSVVGTDPLQPAFQDYKA